MLSRIFSVVMVLSLTVLRYPLCFTFCRLRRPVGRMTVVEQQLEGEFRYVNSRLITHRFVDASVGVSVLVGYVLVACCLSVLGACVRSVMYNECCVFCVTSEEVAFYQGNRKEQAIINTTLQRLVSLLFIIYIIKSFVIELCGHYTLCLEKKRLLVFCLALEKLTSLNENFESSS